MTTKHCPSALIRCIAEEFVEQDESGGASDDENEGLGRSRDVHYGVGVVGGMSAMSRIVHTACLKKLAGCLVVLSAAAGCIIIPTPPHGSLGPGPVIADETIQSLKPNETTRADVLKRLGEPHARFEQERIFVYVWKQIRGYYGWAIGYLPDLIGGGAFVHAEYLCLEFGRGNRLVRSARYVELSPIRIWEVLAEVEEKRRCEFPKDD